MITQEEILAELNKTLATTIETEIMKILNNIMQYAVKIDTGEYSQKTKDDSKRTFIGCLSMVEKELNPRKILQLWSKSAKK